jgi:hypothetical protein
MLKSQSPFLSAPQSFRRHLPNNIIDIGIVKRFLEKILNNTACTTASPTPRSTARTTASTTLRLTALAIYCATACITASPTALAIYCSTACSYFFLSPLHKKSHISLSNMGL